MSEVISMFTAKGNLFLSNVSLKKIEEQYSLEKNAKAKIRLQCAILRKKEKSQPYISDVTGLPVTTISDILKRFEKRGIDGCHAIKQKGQPKKLTPAQRVKLKKLVSRSPEKAGMPYVIWTTKLISYAVHSRLKTDYTPRQIGNILKSMNLTLQKPRPEHLKANKKLQKKFKKNFDGESMFLEKQDMRSYFWTKAHSS